MVQYFIEITPQNKFRAEILTLQKTLLEGLKRCEAFKLIREEKIKEIEKLRKILKELVELCKRFRQELPKVKVKITDKEYARKPAPESLYDYTKELDKLEHSIDEIENKLKGLEK